MLSMGRIFFACSINIVFWKQTLVLMWVTLSYQPVVQVMWVTLYFQVRCSAIYNPNNFTAFFIAVIACPIKWYIINVYGKIFVFVFTPCLF